MPPGVDGDTDRKTRPRRPTCGWTLRAPAVMHDCAADTRDTAIRRTGGDAGEARGSLVGGHEQHVLVVAARFGVERRFRVNFRVTPECGGPVSVVPVGNAGRYGPLRVGGG
ncbi:hypothetical protein GCM10009853_070140 [Glycomyces scopariae]